MEEESINLNRLLAGTPAEKMGLSAGTRYVRDVLNNMESQEEKWTKFALFPDQMAPQRMPVLFPVETHIYKETTVQTLDISGGLGFRAVWQPEYMRGIARFAYKNNYAGSVDNTNPAEGGTVFITTGSNTSRSQVAHGGVRLIGAVLTIDYLGSVEDSQGLIECGLHLNSHKLTLNNADNPIATTEDIHYATDTEMQRLPYNTKHKLSSGIRAIWFPIDKSKFEWRPHFHADGDTFTNDTNDQTPYQQDPVRLEWCINVTAAPTNSSGQARLTMCHYYESIPDEDYTDLFCPERPLSGDSDRAVRAIHEHIKRTGGASHSKSSLSSFFSSTMDKVGQYFMPAVGGLAQGYGIMTGNPMAYGLGAGINSVGGRQQPLAIKSYRS